MHRLPVDSFLHASGRSLGRLPSLILAAALVLGLPGVAAHAAAPAEVDTGHVKAQLLASVGAVHPGERITIGLHQRIVPHWHTYWRNPGDSGLATTIAWTLPPGATAGDIQWPVPSRFTLGPVTNHGYDNEVTLLSDVAVPADAKPGSTFPVRAQVNWLVCQEVCIPEQVQLALTLPVVAAKSARDAGSPLIGQARARLPVASPWPVSVRQQAGQALLRIDHPALLSAQVKDVWFYPNDWGRVTHNAPQPRQADGQALVLQLQPGETPASPGQRLSGVLVVTEESGVTRTVRGYDVDARVQAGPAATSASPERPRQAAPAAHQSSSSGSPSDVGLWSAMVLALLGGLVLNLMPCVFPVLSIKALSLLKHSELTPTQTRLHGVAYTVGVLASFALLGGLLIALKAGGTQVGWGFQFQSPLFVLAVAYLMFAVGLSLSGVFSVGASVAGVGSSLAQRPGYTGSFFTGVLATIVATPCTAPFMGGAVGYALAQPSPVLMAVFLSLGLGLALPYLLLSTWPTLQGLLPRPGLWMERVKQGLAFPMYAAAVWLVWVLAQQAGINAIATALSGMVVIAFAAWVYDSSRTAGLMARRGGIGVTVLALLIALGGGYLGIQTSPPDTGSAVKTTSSGHDWEPYSTQRFDELRAQGQPVFLNFTAAWCITCLVNERVALSKPSVADAFKSAGITYLKGDWTNQDHQITRRLTEFGRSGVPLYVLYPHGRQSRPVVLPQILTPDVVLAAVRETAASPVPR